MRFYQNLSKSDISSDLVIWVGPPSDIDTDSSIVEKFLAIASNRVVCGGTTVNILSRETGEIAEMDLFPIVEPFVLDQLVATNRSFVFCGT